jgi:hypothetical protein
VTHAGPYGLNSLTTRKSWIWTLTLGLILTACSEEQSTTPNPPTSQDPPFAALGGRADGPALSVAGAVTFVGAGDIAGCSASYRDEATAGLLRSISGTVYTLGDNAYPDGTRDNFSSCYSPSWGQFKSRTRPAPGNHDYKTSGAAGYFGYFGSSAGPCCRGYYTYTLGSWRIYSLNSERNLSSQLSWLTSHLANHPARCVLAYWHRPRYSAGPHGSSTRMYDAFNALYRAGAELVLTGHDHNYQRFAPMDAGGQKRSAGVREFVVGTGGAPLYGFPNSAPNLEARYKAWGALQLTLADGAYSWKFLSISGNTLDSGSGTCH